MKRARKNSQTSSPRGYPRPQLERSNWISLNGEWEFAIDEQDRITRPGDVKWDATINVPFSPETPLSGVGNTGLFKGCWYRRSFDAPPLPAGHRLLLHFGAVDYEATVWVNGRIVVRHEGGYTPFFADVTDLLSTEGPQTLVVHAQDDPGDLSKPRGKQDWQEQPHSIWYYRTTGIWQTVWLEVVPATRIAAVRWTPDAEQWEIGLEVQLAGEERAGLQVRVRVAFGDRVLAEDDYSANGNKVARRIGIPDPGIDDYRNEMRWSPESPKLIDAQIDLCEADGTVIDSITSYTAMRSISLLGDRFVLNGKPYPLRLVLNQGYWQEGGLTAPDDEAFRRDVELVKAMGFNGVRMHQKIEDPRFLYWADRLGLLVWEEMPSCYTFSHRTIERLLRQWSDAILRDISHPCIITWVPINESWGVPDLPDSPAQRHLIQAMYHLTKTLDPSRAAIGNDGWEAAATDIIGIHDYDADPKKIAARYTNEGDGVAVAAMLRSERPGHRVLMLPGFAYQDQPIMLTEFGGIAFARDKSHTWGYSRADDVQTFARRYFALLETVRSLPLFAGFCYTQFTDTYQEANGLLYMDRTPKFPLEEIAVATRGAYSPAEQQIAAALNGHDPRPLGRKDRARKE
ncbi:MAG TPA: glycoside hydrolase family 2 TIM barrel-domain containing protein [Tepidisphaeraceae bacterium]|jgi:beta-galactosidase/beta-glucuronidase|nr:glycoside hydrolase family 2 TIM barrel-domain containing protein [Tepidisphaeraceae bacterium]